MSRETVDSATFIAGVFCSLKSLPKAQAIPWERDLGPAVPQAICESEGPIVPAGIDFEMQATETRVMLSQLPQNSLTPRTLLC